MINKQKIRKLIKEYSGTKFYFIADHIENRDSTAIREYVLSNLHNITHRICYGREYKLPQYKGTYNEQQLLDLVMDICNDTIEYINNYVEYTRKI